MSTITGAGHPSEVGPNSDRVPGELEGAKVVPYTDGKEESFLKEGRKQYIPYVQPDRPTTQSATPLESLPKIGPVTRSGRSVRNAKSEICSIPDRYSEWYEYSSIEYYLESWHHVELVKFGASKSEEEREIFLLARGCAELAAKAKEPDFIFTIKYIMKARSIVKQRASELRASLVQKGILKVTQPHSREKHLSTRFAWALPTTIPIPPEPESDDDEVSIFSGSPVSRPCNAS